MCQQKAKFIKELAKYLVGNEVEKSIGLQIGKPESKQWASMRQSSPIFGHNVSVEEAEKILSDWLTN